MNITDLKTYQENNYLFKHLINDYYNLPTNEDLYIILTEKERTILEILHNEIINNGTQIIINTENSFLFNRVEQLIRNSITQGEK